MRVYALRIWVWDIEFGGWGGGNGFGVEGSGFGVWGSRCGVEG